MIDRLQWLCLWLLIHNQASIATRDARGDGDQLWLDETIGDIFHQDADEQQRKNFAIKDIVSEAISKTPPRGSVAGLVVAEESHTPVIGTISNPGAHAESTKSVGLASHSSALPLPFQPLPFQSDGGNSVIAAGSTSSVKTLAQPTLAETQQVPSVDLPLPFPPEAESSSVVKEGPWPLPFQPNGSASVAEAPWPLPFQAAVRKDTMIDASPTPARSTVSNSSSMALLQNASSDILPVVAIPAKAGNVSMLKTTSAATNRTAKRDKTVAATNAVGDGKYFVVNAMITAGIIIVCILFFSVCRGSCKMVYSSRSEMEHAPYKTPNPPSQSFFGWMMDSINMRPARINDVCGIDQAMLIFYTELCLKILLYLFLPLCLIEIPINIWAGGNAAGKDHLSWQGMANVKDDLPYIYWFYAVLVWYVVVVSEWLLFRGMREFIRVRFDWLKLLPQTRAQTVLVEGIPEELCTDLQVKFYFERAVGGPYVAQAALVKRLGEDVHQTYQELQTHQAGLHIALQEFTKTGQKPLLGGSQLDAQTHHEREIAKLEQSLDASRQNLLAYANTEGSGVCYNRGFVTFNKMSAAASALSMTYNEDQDLFMVSAAPDPRDVQFNALTVGPRETRLREFFGYILVLAIFLLFLPLIIWISTHTLSTELVESLPFMKHMFKDKLLKELYNALFGSLSVTVLMSIVPSILMLIFRFCFVLKSSTESQLLCQRCYFYMLFVYILLVISIGSSLADDAKELARHPTAIFSLLATSLPESSHYYLNYVVFQCMAPVISLTRFVNLIKFGINRTSARDEVALSRSEPEDQDYSGVGSRSARLTLIMVVTLSFCTLSPLIVILAIINFGFCRIAYGYLVSYSEQPKPELGGHFFASQMKHTQAGLVFYVILMTGVLLQRAPNTYPAVISACSFAPLFWAIFRFDRAFKWQALPVSLVKEDDAKPFTLDSGCYVQPELAVRAAPQKWSIF